MDYSLKSILSKRNQHICMQCAGMVSRGNRWDGQNKHSSVAFFIPPAPYENWKDNCEDKCHQTLRTAQELSNREVTGEKIKL